MLYEESRIGTRAVLIFFVITLISLYPLPANPIHQFYPPNSYTNSYPVCLSKTIFWASLHGLLSTPNQDSRIKARVKILENALKLVANVNLRSSERETTRKAVLTCENQTIPISTIFWSLFARNSLKSRDSLATNKVSIYTAPHGSYRISRCC